MDDRFHALNRIYQRAQAAGWVAASVISPTELTVDFTAPGLQRMRHLWTLLAELGADNMSQEECVALIAAVKIEAHRQGWPRE